MVKLRRSALVACGVSVLALSCQVLLGIEDPDLHVEQVDGDSGGGVEGSTDGGSTGCGIQPPPPPSSGSGGDRRLVFAIKQIGLGALDTGTGFDLDHACTCASADPTEAQKASCLTPGGGDSGAPSCDLDGGVDNSLRSLLSGFDTNAIANLHEGINKEFTCGRQTLILIVLNYNGGPDDDAVLVFATASFGIRYENGGGDTCLPTYPARWDGTDVWSVSNAVVNANGVPLQSSFQGYVTKNRLVVDGRPQSLSPIPLAGFGSTPMSIARPILMATLTPMDGGIGLADGIIAGRTELSSALGSLGNVASGADAGAYCTTDLWPRVREPLCRVADMMGDPVDDFRGAPCNALSLVASFEATPAEVKAEPAPPPPQNNECDAAALTCP